MIPPSSGEARWGYAKSDANMPNQKARALVVTPIYTEPEVASRIGQGAYSYFYVYRAFAPLLQRWGAITEVTHPESRLDYALWRARQQDMEPLHLSFLPLDLTYLTSQAPNVSFPFWEFPDIPTTSVNNNPRMNWARIAGRTDLILASTTFTRDAFIRAGVSTPVHVVPVPVQPEYGALPAWDSGQRAVLDCPCYVFPPPVAEAPNPWVPREFEQQRRWQRLRLRQRLKLHERGKHVYKRYMQSRMPPTVDRFLSLATRAAASAQVVMEQETHVSYPPHPRFELSGVVYTSILNPNDPRKNWYDLLSAYLFALRDREDATLVVKLVVTPQHKVASLNKVIKHYQSVGVDHRCKLVLIADYLSDHQMVDLARASTYYINASRAEGACLPLQNFLAAGRPGISPAHTAMTDYFHDKLGFVVDSNLEPACWLQDLDCRLTTTWHHIVWQSLHDQIQHSYNVAREGGSRYQDMDARARSDMIEYAGAERVWPLLATALNSVMGETNS